VWLGGVDGGESVGVVAGKNGHRKSDVRGGRCGRKVTRPKKMCRNRKRNTVSEKKNLTPISSGLNGKERSRIVFSLGSKYHVGKGKMKEH